MQQHHTALANHIWLAKAIFLPHDVLLCGSPRRRQLRTNAGQIPWPHLNCANGCWSVRAG